MGWCSQTLTQLQGARGALPAVPECVCVGLLLSVTSGAASPCSLHRKFPHIWVPAASCSLSVTQAPPGVSCANTCSYFLIHLFHIHLCQVAEGGTGWHRGIWKIPNCIDKGCCCIFFPLRILSYNNLTRLDEGSLADLGGLHVLRLSHNSINHIAEGAFRGLKNLRVL